MRRFLVTCPWPTCRAKFSYCRIRSDGSILCGCCQTYIEKEYLMRNRQPMSEMKEAETKRDAIEERLRGDLRPHERYEFQEFLDSFADDIIVELVRQFGGWNSRQTYGQVLAVLRRMIEAWQAGRERLREDIQEI